MQVEVYKVRLAKKAEKELEKLPQHIVIKLASWVEEVGRVGLFEVRKLPGYHDEPLKGKRKGQRSIRLSKSYRAIYELCKRSEDCIVLILEVNKHEY